MTFAAQKPPRLPADNSVQPRLLCLALESLHDSAQAPPRLPPSSLLHILHASVKPDTLAVPKYTRISCLGPLPRPLWPPRTPFPPPAICSYPLLRVLLKCQLPLRGSTPRGRCSHLRIQAALGVQSGSASHHRASLSSHLSSCTIILTHETRTTLNLHNPVRGSHQDFPAVSHFPIFS